MRAVVFTGTGGREVMRLEERPDPVPRSDEVLIAATYAGVNTADLAQRAGQYPAPPGAPPDVPGLEVAGTVVVVGILPKGKTLTIDPWQFFSEKTLKGSFLGSARVKEDIPRLVDLYAAGDLRLDELVDRRIPLSELPEAFERLRAGDGLRQLVVFD